MKTKRLVLTQAIVIAAFGLCSCGSPIQKRIDKNPGVFAKLSAHDQAAVQQGRIREGMDKSAVFIAWGSPDRMSQGKKNGATYERWTYVEFDPVFRQGFGPPYAYHGYRGYHDVYDPLFYAPPAVDYIPHDAAWVEFVGGKVTGWALPKE